MTKRQPLVIEPKQMEDGRMDVVDMRLLLGCTQANGVRAADDLSALGPAPREPHAESMRIVVAAIAAFAHGHAAKFAAPDDERAVEQAARFEVFQ